MSEQEVPGVGERIGRKLNFEDFAKSFVQLGYQIQESDVDRLALMNEYWDSEGNPLADNIQILLTSDDKGAKLLRVLPACEFNQDEYEEITKQLQKGQQAQEKLRQIQEKNSVLEQRLQEAKDMMHGTKTGIKGLKLQKDTEEAALNALRTELALLREDKEDIVKFIADKDPTVKAIETEIAALVSRQAEAEKLCKEEEAALKRARVAAAEERAGIEEDYNQREQEIQKQIDEKTKALEEASEKVKTRRDALAEAIKKDRKKLDKINQELDAKKAAHELVSKQAEEKTSAPSDVTKTPEYTALKGKLNKRDLIIRRFIRRLTDLDPQAELDNTVLTQFERKLIELKKKEDPAVLAALNTLCAKLDEVSAEVLEKEPEPQPKATDTAIGRFLGKAKDTIFRKRPEPEESAVDKSLEVSKYLGILNKLKDAVDDYRQQAADYKAAEKAPEPSPEVDEKAEGLLEDLLGAVDAVPDDEEVANPAYVRAFVEGVRNCGFELYSLIASRNPEGMVYVLSELADSKYEEGDIAAAVELTKKGIALCKEQLPDDKETLADFEANLQIYSGNRE